MKRGGTDNSVAALEAAIERGLLAAPSPWMRWLALNAPSFGSHLTAFKPVLECEQGFRPIFLSLEYAGFTVSPTIGDTDDPYDCTMVFAGRSRAANEANIARAWAAVRTGGIIVIAGEKASGIAALRRHVAETTEIDGQFSKSHAQLFWFSKTHAASPFQSEAGDQAAISPAMFSAGRPDAGSVILADHFSNEITGIVADFGAGWGYLGDELLKRSSKITALDCYEADWQSLELAKQRLAGKSRSVAISFFWLDLVREKTTHSYDWIVMNPPFHAGRAQQPEIGIAFITAAATALKPGGQLLMVANRKLPYEAALKKLFSRFEPLEARDGFKVFSAIR